MCVFLRLNPLVSAPHPAVRLALARAVYHRCSLFLIDDVLAAVDNTSAAHIINHLLLSPGLLGLIPPQQQQQLHESNGEEQAKPGAAAWKLPHAGHSATVVLVTKSRRSVENKGEYCICMVDTTTHVACFMCGSCMLSSSPLVQQCQF